MLTHNYSESWRSSPLYQRPSQTPPHPVSRNIPSQSLLDIHIAAAHLRPRQRALQRTQTIRAQALRGKAMTLRRTPHTTRTRFPRRRRSTDMDMIRTDSGRAHIASSMRRCPPRIILLNTRLARRAGSVSPWAKRWQSESIK